MKVIIAGSRGITDQDKVNAAMADALYMWQRGITEVVSGCARGVDRLGERWAEDHGIPVKRFPADWDNEGRKAGPLRNRRMAEYADALIAVWDGCSTGTLHMIDCMKRLKKQFYVYRVLG